MKRMDIIAPVISVVSIAYLLATIRTSQYFIEAGDADLSQLLMVLNRKPFLKTTIMGI